MYLRVPLYNVNSEIPTGDLNKYKYVIIKRICISLLYDFMKILISSTVYLLLLYALL